jgi:serpin B
MSITGKVHRLGMVFLALLLIAGCGGSGGSSGNGVTTTVTNPAPSSPAAPPDGGSSGNNGVTTVTAQSSALSRNLAPGVTPLTEQSVVTAVNSLGANLLGQGQDNAVVAPFSASLSLARLRAGAVGQTRTDLSTAVLFSGMGTEIDPAYNKIDLAISSRIASTSLDGQTSQTSANGWVQARYGYLITYLDTLALNYGIKPARTDFTSAQSDSTSSIYTWASQASGGLGCTFNASRDARMVLGDAVRLNAAWADPFNPAQSVTDSFRFLNGNNKDAQFLRKSTQIPHTTGNGYVALELPFSGNDLRFLVVLPDEGRFQEIRGEISAGWLNQVVAAMSPVNIDLALPLFSIDTEIQLPLGSSPSTKDIADFSAIDGTKDLFVSSTVHRSKLAITAQGLKAGSATLIALDDAHPETWTNPDSPGYSSGFILTQDGSSWLSPYVPVTLGRPFLFAVRDSVTGAILFLGQVLYPTF